MSESTIRDTPKLVPESDEGFESEPDISSLKIDTESDYEDYFELAMSHHDRFQQSGAVSHIEMAIDFANRALKSIPDDHSDLRNWHSALGAFHADRFQRLGEPSDIEKAIKHFSRALELTPEGDSDLPNRHTSIGSVYVLRFRHLGELADLEKARQHYSRALILSPEDHPRLADLYTSLGSSYFDQFQRLGELDDLDKATDHFARALALTPEGHPHLPARYTSLGAAYDLRFERLGEVVDLEKAIEYFSRELEFTPEGHPNSANPHANLGRCYNTRFIRLDELSDLEKALEHCIRALELTPEGHPDLPGRYTDLGRAYGDRFQRLDNLGDLEEAMDCLSRALALTPEGHPNRPDQHTNLGIFYATRLARLGELGDLDKAHEQYVRALELTPEGHPDLPDRYENLASTYTRRFRRLHEQEDLETAIEHLSCALALTPVGHPSMPHRLASLGSAYGLRYAHTGGLEDIEKTMECFSSALELTPEGHPSLPSRYADLRDVYICRYRRLGETHDLDKAIEHTSLAIALTPDGHPALPQQYSTNADNLFLAYQQTDDPSYLDASLASFRTASQLSTGSPRVRFQNALEWVKRARYHSLQSFIEAYQTAMDLLPQFIWLGATTHQRYHDLITAEHLGVNAAHAAISHGDYSLALEWLEHARCVVWNQTVMLRSPADNLRLSYPDLAARLEEVARQLHNTSSESPASDELSSGPVNTEEIGRRRRGLAKEYDALLAEARMLPGFDDFLQPVRANRLVRAARIGPIVVINCHQDQSDALLILPGQENIQHLLLPNFSEHKARANRKQLEKSLRAKGVRERGIKPRGRSEGEASIACVLLDLWDDVVKPVLDFLGYMDHVSAQDLPHITWCPTGTLAFLPLHAAGDYDQPGSRVFDHVISSYTPTLSALLGSPPTSLDCIPRVLAIGQANTPDHSPLPGTTTELASVKYHTGNRAEYSELVGDQATTTEVLDAMEQHDWVHLSCHAHQNIIDPTKSGFFLHDGTLDLASINQRSFKNKGLAFLSACQTATGDENLPDEAIHLASGMMMAGYPSVIATMWSVMDADAPVIADQVYAELMQDGNIGNGQAGKALHHAVAGLREQVGEKEFVRWVPYIHIGS